MSSIIAASYLPDSQVITLKPEFDALSNPDPVERKGFVGPSQIGFFFHEWTHYLHNVSTIQGLSAFCTLVHLWGVFRHTMDDGVSRGSNVLDDKLALNLRQKVEFMLHQRRPSKNELPTYASISNTKFIAAATHIRKIDGTEFDLAKIECRVIVSLGGEEKFYNVQVGSHEILESVAHALESRLVRKLGAVPADAPIAPYLLVRGLASHVAPDIQEDILLACTLASLQDSDPPGILLEILDHVQGVIRKGECPLTFLIEKAKFVLENAKSWIDESLAEIDAAFPVDEPMARAVKNTTDILRRNFASRLNNPFFEIDLVNTIAADPSYLNSMIKTYGACAIIQQRHGDPNKLDKDYMYDFELTGRWDEWLSFGYRQMHAAFRFVGLHISAEGVTPTGDLELGKNNKCPFYSTCSYPLREKTPDVCATRPWLSSKTNVSEICWYGNAIRTLASH